MCQNSTKEIIYSKNTPYFINASVKPFKFNQVFILCLFFNFMFKPICSARAICC